MAVPGPDDSITAGQAQSAHERPKAGRAARDERSFSRACGVVFQAAGLVLAIGGCCLWSASGLFQPSLATSQPASTAVGLLHQAPPAQVCAAVGIAATFTAGMAFFAVGMGLHSEKRWSGVGAMIASGLLALFWLVELLLFVVWARSVAGTLVALILLILAVTLFLLAGAAAGELKLHPPPVDLNVVPPDFDLAYRSRPPLPPDRTPGAD